MPNARQDYSYIDDWKSQWEPDLEAIAYNGATCDPTRVDSKVLDWVKENCGNKPRFVKVINRNAAHGQPGLVARSSACLVVPAPFVQEHFRDLQRVITLENGGGRKWKVSFAAAEKHPLWLQGWRVFARDNNLKPGDVMVFELVRNSHFRFTIFDDDGNISQNRASTVNDAGVRRELSYSSLSHLEPSATGSEEHPWSRKRVLLSDSDTEEAEEAELDNAPHNEAGPSSFDRHGQAVSQRLMILKSEQVPATPCKRRRLRKMVDMGKVQTMNSDTNSEEEVIPLRERPANTNVSNSPRYTSDCEGHGVDRGRLQQLVSEPLVLQGTISPFDPFNPLALTILSKRRMVTALERQRAKDLAEVHAQVTTSPNFLAVMSDAQVYRNFQLTFPDRFVMESGIPTSKIRLTLVDCTGKSFEMHSRENVHSQVALYRKPWALFALHHLLEEGDACVFQLADKDTRTILVRIFRVVHIPVVGRKSVHDHYELRAKVQS